METSLPTEVIFNLLLSSDYNTIINLCPTSTAINKVCQDNHFWNEKFIRDFGDFLKLSDKTWRQSYEIILRADEYLREITDERGYLSFEINDVNFIRNKIRILTYQPVRIVVYYGIEDDMLHVRYDAIYQRIDKRRLLGDDFLRIKTYRFIKENVINEHDALHLIYTLLVIDTDHELIDNTESNLYH